MSAPLILFGLACSGCCAVSGRASLRVCAPQISGCFRGNNLEKNPAKSPMASAASAFLEDFDGDDDGNSSGSDTNAGPAQQAVAGDAKEAPITSDRLKDILKMGMAGAQAGTAPSNGSKPGGVSPTRKKQRVPPPVPRFTGVSKPLPPPGFAEATSGSASNAAEKVNTSSTDRPASVAPPPGFAAPEPSPSPPPGFKAAAAAAAPQVSRKRRREPDPKSSSTAPPGRSSGSGFGYGPPPKPEVRDVSERDWARVDSILDLAMSRVQPQDPKSRAAMRRKLMATPLLRAIAANEQHRERYNKMVAEAIAIEDRLLPFQELIVAAAQLE